MSACNSKTQDSLLTDHEAMVNCHKKDIFANNDVMISSHKQDSMLTGHEVMVNSHKTLFTDHIVTVCL